jgi:hypothetical protein
MIVGFDGAAARVFPVRRALRDGQAGVARAFAEGERDRPSPAVLVTVEPSAARATAGAARA